MLRHEIETNALSNSADDRAKLKTICDAVSDDNPDLLFQLCDDPWHIKVIARCNGYALRDLVYRLDLKGFLGVTECR